MYVAMTRAKDHLFLTYHTDDIDDNISRSEFLNDIKIEYEKYENSENEEQNQ